MTRDQRLTRLSHSVQHIPTMDIGVSFSTAEKRTHRFADPHEPRTQHACAGRRGYGVGVRVLVLVNGQWLHGKAVLRS